MDEKQILELVRSDIWMMNVLIEAQKLALPNWMVGAGFLRNKVWDCLHNIKRAGVDTNDIDLIYFDKKSSNEHEDRLLSERMSEKYGFKWDVKNQSYMHIRHGHEPYASIEEAISYWVETATCVAVTVEGNHLKLIAAYGISDLVDLVLRPVPISENSNAFTKRQKSKKWIEKWPELKISPK